tara:strand:- start:166 stop:612 length:447 start_codon:yes stop_codon:yes gene_type:complete
MFWGLFRSKFFWLILVTLSLIGGVIGWYHNTKKNEALKKVEILYCEEFREDMKSPAIIVINRHNLIDDYIANFTGNKKYNGFRFTRLNQGQKVHVLEHIKGGLIAKIAVVNPNPTMRQGAYYEYWIWHEFLSTDSTLTDPFPINKDDF